MQNIHSPRTRQTQEESPSQRSKVGANSGSHPWYNSHNPSSQKLTIYQREMEISSNWTSSKKSSVPKRKKNDIQKFSRKSRLRLLRKFNRLQTAKLSPPIFVTLTARRGSLDPQKFRERFLSLFIPKLKEYIPSLVYTWRIEPHKTGYPHIHMFIWSELKDFNINSTFYWKKIRADWRDVIKDRSRASQLHSCKIKKVHNFKKAITYVAKYLAKEDEVLARNLVGRRWGCSTNFPDSPIAEVYLSPGKARVFRIIALALINERLRKQGREEFDPDTDANLFIWLEPSQIVGILRDLSQNGIANKYERVANRGDPWPSDSDLAEYQEYYT